MTGKKSEKMELRPDPPHIDGHYSAISIFAVSIGYEFLGMLS
jgi:hypothetical protein